MIAIFFYVYYGCAFIILISDASVRVLLLDSLLQTMYCVMYGIKYNGKLLFVNISEKAISLTNKYIRIYNVTRVDKCIKHSIYTSLDDWVFI